MAETKLATMNDLGEIKSIDFVNKFSKNINDLLRLLGVTRRQELTNDLKIQTYKWASDLTFSTPARLSVPGKKMSICTLISSIISPV